MFYHLKFYIDLIKEKSCLHDTIGQSFGRGNIFFPATLELSGRQLLSNVVVEQDPGEIRPYTIREQ